jgi:hypothetical protein
MGFALDHKTHMNEPILGSFQAVFPHKLQGTFSGVFVHKQPS